MKKGRNAVGKRRAEDYKEESNSFFLVTSCTVIGSEYDSFHDQSLIAHNHWQCPLHFLSAGHLK
ncbi:hypothetical protein [Lysinibacillus sp. 3P01SB]|uniref:hypothetical protein n=1 Tax=Lysinibacillus sp. 3P01SB TaxID=3132284 RepID=UPI0039A55368